MNTLTITQIKRAAAFAALCFVFFSLAVTSAYPQGKKARRALIISIDGLDTRYIQDPDKYGLKIPTLRKLMAGGIYAEGMMSVYPSVTYPNHTSMVTGAMPLKHGIIGNGVFEDPSQRQTGAWYWYANDIAVDTLWDAASREGLTTGGVSWPVSVGAGDWSIPEIWKPGGTPEDAMEVMSASAKPRGLYQEIDQAIPDLFSKSTPDEGDDARTRMAEFIIEKKRPNVMLVHIYDLDHFEHDYGPLTPQAFEILEKTDVYVARMLDALERAGIRDETTVFVLSDHGFLPYDKAVRPGAVLRREGLVEVEETKDANGRTSVRVTDWRAAVYTNAANCAIYLKDPDDEDTRKKVTSVFKKLEGAPDSGIYRILEPEEILAEGSNPRAALMIDPADGYTCGGGYGTELITETGPKGNHGYLPSRPNFRASFVASGPGVTRRGRIKEIHITDAAVTIAASLGLTLKHATGKAVKLN